MELPILVRKIIHDIRLGVVIGVLLAVLTSVVALLILLVRGQHPFDSNHLSVVRVIATYLLAGVLGGMLVGLSLPLARWMPGAALVGFLAAFVLWFVVTWSISSEDPLLSILKTSAVLGVAFGLPIGVGFWYQQRRYERTGKWS